METQTVEKPWGSYDDLFRSNEVVVKFLHITRDQKISNQRHSSRKEKWVVISGYGEAILESGDSLINLKLSPGVTFNVLPEVWHQVKCDVESPVLTVLEIQESKRNHACVESDIERKEDIL